MDTKSLLALVEVAARAIASEPIGSPKTQAIAVGVVSLLEITRALREQAAATTPTPSPTPAAWGHGSGSIKTLDSGIRRNDVTPAEAGVQSVPVAPAQQQ